ncbi:hypothetical protein BIZ71_gp66 [Gordonia phage Hedwig]|uniref:Uncharacterized protein n=1 Tax=Gordonia phage Hedwig TaxID=1887648 RepID=A0A1C9EHU8_9CAUD|nr:hypothetical protein BIZ71_gp66 [Gordonia phage Hedwig]AON97359.1 hypothetical protein SEA_HEDWIG_66 [Gordonia phage Hedwig]
MTDRALGRATMRRRPYVAPRSLKPGDRVAITYSIEQFADILRNERRRARRSAAEARELGARLREVTSPDGNDGGTATTYRCRDCGETWTWRNTPDGDRGLAETQALHGGQLYPIGATQP